MSQIGGSIFVGGDLYLGEIEDSIIVSSEIQDLLELSITFTSLPSFLTYCW